MKRLAMIAAGLLVLMVGCADGSDGSFVSGSAPNSAQVAGTWDGEGTVTSGTRYPAATKITLNFNLSQFENLVVGTFTQDGVDSNLEGVVRDRLFIFDTTQGAPCPGSFTGSATVSVLATGQSCAGTVSMGLCSNDPAISCVSSANCLAPGVCNGTDECILGSYSGKDCVLVCSIETTLLCVDDTDCLDVGNCSTGGNLCHDDTACAGGTCNGLLPQTCENATVVADFEVLKQ